MVDLIFEEFKKDYYPGEHVTVHVVSGERLAGVVRAKTRFGSKMLPSGAISPAFSRYFVSLDDRPFEEAVVDDDHITRDRKIFTKQVLRAFIKKTVSREAHFNAPWCVKPDVAERYRIDMRIPPHLRHENQVAERKQKMALKKGGGAFDDMVGVFQGGQKPQLPELKPAPKSHKSKMLQSELTKSKKPISLNPSPNAPPMQYQYMAPPPPNYHGPIFVQNGHHLPHGPPMIHQPPPQQIHFHNQQYQYSQVAHPQQQQRFNGPPLAPAPPPIKYPIDDLQVAPRTDDSVRSLKRPELKFMSEDTPVPVDENPATGPGIKMESVGNILECWDTLNVYAEVFLLDSFTLDDFIEAMQIASEDVDCELFTEVHCAALKLLVSPEGHIGIELPAEDEEEDSDDEMVDSAQPTPTPEPEPLPKKRATRSSLAKAEAEAIKAEQVRSPNPEVKKTHMGLEMSSPESWSEKLAKRDFKNGGWQFIIVGLLVQLLKFPRHEKVADELLQHLAPMDFEPNQETAKVQYGKMNFNMRVKVLEILCMLLSETKHLRNFMEECASEMTQYRKEKMEYQRERKDALEQLRLLMEEKRKEAPVNTAPIDETKTNGETNGDVDMEDKPAEASDNEISEDEISASPRALRRGNDRAAERQRKREVEAERKAQEAKAPKHSKAYTKLLKDIQKKQDVVKENEERIKVIDNDLREADCNRTRVLGRDRFWNRYYWFERNGMPYAGLPTSSTSNAGYANGRIWVQGPDELEREGYIDMKKEWQDEYIAKFGVAVPERKKKEEGATSLFNARQWGYYDDPEDVNKLLQWLDIRGREEKELLKQLQIYQEKIKTHMEKRNDYLKHIEEKRMGDMERRTSSRKHHASRADEYGCLAWHNDLAVEKLGYLHSDQPRTRAKAKKAVEVEAEKGKRKNKVPGRQGIRYDF